MAPSQKERLAAKADEQLVNEARSSLARAERAEADASAWKWEVADRVRVLRERGWTHARIGDAIGFSETSARRYVKVAKRHAGGGSRPVFGDAIAEIEPGSNLDELRGAHETAAAGRVLREQPDAVAELVKDPAIRNRLRAAVADEDARAEQALPAPRPPGREPLHWMLLKFTALGLGHDRLIAEEGDRIIGLSVELRTAGGQILETNVAKLAAFREALLAETHEERVELLAEALKLNALKRADLDEEFADLLGGAA